MVNWLSFLVPLKILLCNIWYMADYMCSVHFMKHDNKPSTCELTIHLQKLKQNQCLWSPVHSDRGNHYVDFFNKFFSHNLHTIKFSHLKYISSWILTNGCIRSNDKCNKWVTTTLIKMWNSSINLINSLFAASQSTPTTFYPRPPLTWLMFIHSFYPL